MIQQWAIDGGDSVATVKQRYCGDVSEWNLKA
jgi:hypothetical protein